MTASRGRARLDLGTWLPIVGLFLIALVIRAWAASLVPFAPNEGSAYYAGVARNLIEGRGLVSDAIWSYATPPLVLPKPAFELWLPMASFLAAIPIAVFGTSFAAAQVSSVVLGAAVAPLTWLVARDAARRNGLDDRRVLGVSLGSGLAAAALGPFLVAAAGPDSMTPFLVFGVAACMLMPRALDATAPRRRQLATGVALGAVLGLAYLSRQEAIYLGVTFLVLAWSATGQLGATTLGRLRSLGSLLVPTVVGGLLVVGPWLMRNALAFGTLFPGQALENVYLTTNEGIFAYTDRPTLGAFLDQGLGTIVGHQLDALVHDLVQVLLLPGFPVAVLGIVALVVLRRSPAMRGGTALRALLVSGVLTYLVTSLLLPVATLWGTFLHASGPLLVGLIVSGMLVLDAAVARISRLRGWGRPNPWLAPITVIALTAPLGLLQASLLGTQSNALAARYAALSVALSAVPEVATGAPRSDTAAQRAAIVSDHPVWLAETLRRPVIALPDESPTAVAQLARDFGASVVLVLDDRGRHPGALLEGDGIRCFQGGQLEPAADPQQGYLFILKAECGSR